MERARSHRGCWGNNARLWYFWIPVPTNSEEAIWFKLNSAGDSNVFLNTERPKSNSPSTVLRCCTWLAWVSPWLRYVWHSSNNAQLKSVWFLCVWHLIVFHVEWLSGTNSHTNGLHWPPDGCYRGCRGRRYPNGGCEWANAPIRRCKCALSVIYCFVS
jgi:hypothetical protein